MFKYLSSLFLLLVVSYSSFAGDGKDSTKADDATPTEKIYGPTIGLGVGMLKFYGDILDANYGNPLISNIGYDLHVKQRLNSFLTAKFYVLFGSISANERSINRNLNFKSVLTTGGFALIYDFSHLLPEKRIINPFISLGIESVEFHSKTDLYDQYGNKYNYWSDGSIRNLPENDINAANAIVIERDYVYETDLRESNYDGKGKYPERTFAIPFGAGAIFHATDNIDFTVSTTYHYTFTDLIDNVSADSKGDRIGLQPGNKGNDKFLMTSFSISYNFLRDKKQEQIKEFGEDINYMAFDNADEDGDGVIDFKDKCPWTPPGVEVDSNGCPLDKDKDFVPNYKDDELETRAGVPVSPNGVELTDTMMYVDYQRYLDSTGIFAETETIIIAAPKLKNKIYKVQVGSFTEAIDADLVDKFLSIPDVEIKTFGDSLTIIAVGDYKNLPDAVKRKIQLTEQGFDAALVVQQEKDGTFKSVGDSANNMNVDASSAINTQGLIFRVQLGAFSKRLPKSSFNGLKNIMEIKADDGLYKYLYTGSFTTFEEAANKKLDLAIDYGVKDAFIVAYKNQLPTEVLAKFMEIENVEQVNVGNGLTRYTSGNFKTFDEAVKHRNELIVKGISGAFIISFEGDKLIPIEKAKELSGEQGK